MTENSSDAIVIVNYENRSDYFKQFRQNLDFVFVDEVTVRPGVSAEGKKLVSSQDWYMKMHFPGDPMMPGVFQMEAIQQTGGLIINTMDGKQDVGLLLSKCEKVAVLRAVRPGCALITKVVLESYRRGVAWFRGTAEVDGHITLSMRFSLIAPQELQDLG